MLQSKASYQSKVGSIIYPICMTRPDIAYASSQLAQFMHNLLDDHHLAADRVIRYLDGTSTYALEFGSILEATVCVFEGSSDASFANLEGQKSSEGRYFQLFGGSIDWKAGKQSIIQRSTTETELSAASNSSVDLIFWKRLFASLDFDINHTPFLNLDNLQTVGIINKEADLLKTNLKYVDIHQH
jgi:hypothetical protein